MNKEYSKKSTMTIVLFILLCSLLTALNASNNPFRIGNSAADSSVFIYVAKVILSGGMPYKDTFDHKGPLMYLINACGLLINKQVGIWLIELFTVFSILFFSVRISKLLGCGKKSSIAVVIFTALGLTYYFDGGNVSEEYACVFIIISLYIFVKYFQTETVSNIQLALCGASLAAVCLLRINMVSLWAVMCIGILCHCIKNNKAKELTRFIIWFLFGFILVGLPIMIWLLKNNAFDAFIKDYFNFNMLYANNNERATFTKKVSALAFFCAQPVPVLTGSILVYCCVTEKKLIDILCLLSTMLSLLVMSMSGQTYPHYGLILIPLFSYAAALGLSNIVDRRKKPPHRSVIITIVCTVLLLFAHTIVEYTAGIVPVLSRSGVSADDKAVAEVIQKYTDDNDKISVCGNNDIIYLLSERYSSSIYSYQLPIANVDPVIKEEYLKDIFNLSAKAIVISENGFLYDEMAEILKYNYILVEKVNNTGVYILKDVE